MRRFRLNINGVYFIIVISYWICHYNSLFRTLLKNFAIKNLQIILIQRIQSINSPKWFHMHLTRSNLFFWASFSQNKCFFFKIYWCYIYHLIILFRLCNSIFTCFKSESHKRRFSFYFFVLIKRKVCVHKLAIQCRQQWMPFFIKFFVWRINIFAYENWWILSIVKLRLIICLVHKFETLWIFCLIQFWSLLRLNKFAKSSIWVLNLDGFWSHLCYKVCDSSSIIQR